MISKELLSEVYNFDVKDIVELGTDNVTYEVKFNGLKNGKNYDIINIYELAHKCKEWAVKDGFHLISYTISYEAVKEKGYCQTHHIHHKDRENDKPFHANSEPEAIFKACQWILENKQ